MPPTNLICHQAHVVSGTKSYPLYVSFCPANELADLAAAPAFAPNTSNDVLAASAATPPIHNWQRPLDGDRVLAMAHTFSQAGELMPNPVLLSENEPRARERPNYSICPRQRQRYAVLECRDRSTGPC
jgi:hypothetical protein